MDNVYVLRTRMDEGIAWDYWQLIIRSVGGEVVQQWMRGPVLFVRFRHAEPSRVVWWAIKGVVGHSNFLVLANHRITGRSGPPGDALPHVARLG